MRVEKVENVKFKAIEDPNGGWIVSFTCPAEACGARSTASGENKSGPFWGSCRRGHIIQVPYIK